MLNMVDDVDFVDWLEAQMKVHNVNQSQLATRGGITRSAINKLLSRQQREPGTEMLKAIAKGLSVPPEIVLRAAGLLPPERTPEEKYEELLSILDTFTEEQRKDVLRYARFVSGENEKASLERKTKPRTGTAPA